MSSAYFLAKIVAVQIAFSSSLSHIVSSASVGKVSVDWRSGMGGGVMRTAAKAASLGTFLSPIVDEAARRAARHQVAAIPSVMPAVDSALSMSSISSDREQEASSAVSRWPAWEIDDWEFAGVEEEKLAPAEPSPRLVFAPLPTLEEAKEATADLKEAMEMVYFQPNYAPSSHSGCQSSVSGESNVISSAPKHVAQMFSLLHGSSEAQVVVASLASDKNVWEAVMKNEMVMEFCKNPPTIATPEANKNPLEPCHENEFLYSGSSAVEPKEATGGSMLADMLNNFKVKVMEMMGNLSDVLQDFFGIETGNSKSKTSTAEGVTNMAFGASFVALAIAVIMVILLKRG